MDRDELQGSWIERVEALVNILQGSSISELELTEAGTEIIIRRQMAGAPTPYATMAQVGIPVQIGVPAPLAQEESAAAIIAPLTGVYYSSPSPDSPPFVSIGDTVQVGQVVALVEAMKVFNEIQAEVSGRVSAIVATSGEVVQKGDILIRIRPA